MENRINRRKFLQVSAAAGLASSMIKSGKAHAAKDGKARVGFTGVGNQGTNLLETSLAMQDIEVPAICDINKDNLSHALDLVEKSGRKRPEGYSADPEDYRRMSEREDLDAVLTATPWELHVPVMVDAMNKGKYACTEVPAAYTVEGCWDLVETSERTGMPMMMLENHCYQLNNTAVLQMVRAGLFGELLHGECGYQHDVRYLGGKEGKIGANGELLWRGKHAITRNGDLYPTHGLGPVAHWMDINCGDQFHYLTSAATISRGMNTEIAKRFGKNHPNATREYALGDVVTTVIRTRLGRTITINHDTQSPRPYSNMTKIQGTKGLYVELNRSVYFEDLSPEMHRWEPFDAYEKKYEHPMWTAWQKISATFGHGGTDYLKLRSFFDAVKDRNPVPIDVYDAVAWSVISPLSEKSIANGSAPVEFPDFTNGKWKTRKPFFGV